MPTGTADAADVRPEDGRPASWRGGLFYAGQALFLVVVLFVYVRGWDRDFGVPFRFSRDSLSAGMLSKSTLDNGWWWFNPKIGAPFGLDERQYPANPNVDQAVTWVVGRIVGDSATAQNIAWLVMVILSGLTATWCLRAIGTSRPCALVAGTLFALTPYALYRSTGHLWLVIYLVPFACTAALQLATARLGPWRSSLPLAAGCCLLGFNYIYYAFFACFMLLVGAVIGSVQYRAPRVLGAGLLLVALIGTGTIVNLAPNLRSWAEHGQPLLVPDKTASESEVYGLKIRQLVSPGLWHRFPPFRAWLDREQAAQFPLENENGSSRLGVVASLGFLGLLALLVVPRLAQPMAARETVFAASRLTLAAVLLATVGGLGSLFSLLVAPEIRAYNRISPFIAFFALAAVALVVDAILTSPSKRLVAAGAIGLVGLADQRAAAVHLNVVHQDVAAEFRSLTDLVRQLEARLPADAMVFQLPFRMYPHDDGGPRAQPYENLKPYLASRSLRWSYPALTNQQVRWQQAAALLPLDRLVGELVAQGFAAVLVDRDGYADDGRQVSAALGGALGAAATLAETRRYVAFDLRRVTPVAAAASLLFKAAGPEPATAGLVPCADRTLTDINRLGALAGPFESAPQVRRSRDLTVSGWAVDRVAGSSAGGVDLVLDGHVFQTVYGLERGDVARSLQGPQYVQSGFIGVVPAALMARGQHALTLRVATSDRRCYFVSAPLVIVAD